MCSRERRWQDRQHCMRANGTQYAPFQSQVLSGDYVEEPCAADVPEHPNPMSCIAWVKRIGSRIECRVGEQRRVFRQFQRDRTKPGTCFGTARNTPGLGNEGGNDYPAGLASTSSPRNPANPSEPSRITRSATTTSKISSSSSKERICTVAPGISPSFCQWRRRAGLSS